MKSALLSLGLALACGAAVQAQSTPQGSVPPHDPTARTTPAAARPTAPVAIDMTTHESETLDKLHAANVLEIEAGKLAVKHAAANDVKRYGEHLIKDHSKSDRELSALAKRNGVKLANVDKSKLDDLKALTGADFDRAFLNRMVKDHKQAIELVRTEQGRAQNAEIRAFLDKVLPVLEAHERHAQQLNDARS